MAAPAETRTPNLHRATESLIEECGWKDGVAKQVGNAVSKWRDEAARHGLTQNEIDRMASAFEHEDLKAARATK